MILKWIYDLTTTHSNASSHPMAALLWKYSCAVTRYIAILKWEIVKLVLESAEIEQGVDIWYPFTVTQIAKNFRTLK